MKPSIPQIKREVLFVGGATLLALVPLILIWRKSLIPPRPLPTGTMTPTVAPITSALPIEYGEAQISPDGQLFARKETGLVPTTVPAPSSGTPTPKWYSARSRIFDQIVLRSVKTGEEVFRAVDFDAFAGWVPGSQSFVLQKGGDVSVFTSLNGASGKTWKQKTWSFSADKRSLVGHNPSEANELDLRTGQILFSPDFRFAVKSSWGYGQVVWQAADLKRGKMYPPLTAGRWLGYDPHVQWFSHHISAAVAPGSLGSSGKPVVVLLQTTDVKPIPTATPVPVATPSPTATYSPAQTEFLRRRDKENAEIEALVGKVEGVDGAEPEVTDEAEVARISKEVKRRNKALYAEEKRYFPPVPVTVNFLNRLRTKPKDYWSMFQLECFDLGTGKELWKTPIKSHVLDPRMRFSPDGTSLVVWGTAAFQPEFPQGNLEGTGIEFRVPLTGALTRKAALYEGNFMTTTQEETAFYESNKKGHSVFVVKDVYETPRSVSSQGHAYIVGDRNYAFRFFDARSAREIGHLNFDPKGFDQDDLDFMDFSVSQNGGTWLWGSKDVLTVTRKELGQDNAGPLPTPTSLPIRHIRTLR